jgi:hypothetical protein
VRFPSAGTPKFWSLYFGLPESVRATARKAYGLWQEEPFHPSLHFKKVGGGKWSVRVGLHYRAVGKFANGTMVWDWIGSHGDYDRLTN